MPAYPRPVRVCVYVHFTCIRTREHRQVCGESEREREGGAFRVPVRVPGTRSRTGDKAFGLYRTFIEVLGRQLVSRQTTVFPQLSLQRIVRPSMFVTNMIQPIGRKRFPLLYTVRLARFSFGGYFLFLRTIYFEEDRVSYVYTYILTLVEKLGDIFYGKFGFDEL